MARKCEHLEACEDCSKKIPQKPSEPVSRIQQLLSTLERKQAEVEVATSNENRYKVSIESGLKEHRKAVELAETSLDQTRLQLVAELRKFDVSMADLAIDAIHA